MTLTKLEQSGFIIETKSGFKLALDIGRFTPLEKLSGMSVDSFLVSHIHGDHFSIDHIKALSPKEVFLNSECQETLGEETFSFKINTINTDQTFSTSPGDISVQVFSVDHGPNVTAPLKENFGFLINADGETIYFAGDMYYPSGLDVPELEVDYALIPVGTHYTFGPAEAFDFIKKFKKIGKVIPMHYEKTPETREQFVELAKADFTFI
jgi:L-ascorbate metabolism protein UlaG (beta-lactamase superfamily)